MEKKNKLCTIDDRQTCKNIKKMMEEKSITPLQIKKELNLGSVQAVYKWIGPNSNHIPSIENLVFLAQLFECKLEDIIGYKQ